jgi:two-component system, NarL family, sensor histidine kinase DesK
MPPTMRWLAAVVRLAALPLFLGAVILWLEPQRSGRDQPVALGLLLLGLVHLLYWWRPWPPRSGIAAVAAAAMVATNLALIHLLGLSQPLLWLYPALVVGAGLRAAVAAIIVTLLALAALSPMHLDEALVDRALGPGHWILLSIVLTGLGMTAVRQLIAVNADLLATKAELAELAVATERERLARELHDLLGRTLSLIAVKAELASRLSAKGDPSADAELRDVQRLARDAVREVREAVAGDRAPSVAAELEGARLALQTAGIEPTVVDGAREVDPAHEATVAWAIREAVTNVVKHSGARRCRITLSAVDGTTELEVVDDGRGPEGARTGLGLAGLGDRLHALGGTFEAGPGKAGGFRLRATLGAPAPASSTGGVAR